MMLFTIGTTRLYSGALNSAYDATANTGLDALTNEELDAISGSLVRSSEPISIEHELEGRSTASFSVYDEDSSLQFYERQAVLIEDNDRDRYFAGVVQAAEEVRLPNTTKKFHMIEAVDFTSILDWRIADYAAEDKFGGDAVRDLMEDYLTEEGISEGYIEDGYLLTEISIGNKSLSDAYDKLAEACNTIYYVDYWMRLFFHTRSLYAAEWNIYDGTDIIQDSLQIVRSNPNYRNTEITIGGYEETDLQTENFYGDGATKTFPLAYPVNRISTVTVNGTAKTVGEKGSDSGSYESYYAIESETFTFETAPAQGAIIEIQYYGLWVAKSKAEDLTAIADNVTRQGFGSGKVEHITIDDSLTSVAAAGEYANAKLTTFAVDGIAVKYKTRRPGLAAGTLQHIEILDINDDFLISRVTEETIYGDTEYSVEAYHGPVNDSWEKFFRGSFTAVYTIREGVDDSGVTKLYNFSHTWMAADRPNPFTLATIGTGLAVSDDSWPCFEKVDRALYIEFWRDGACVFRKRHTSVPGIALDTTFSSYSYIAPSEAMGDIDEVVFWGGDLATLAYGSGVELYRANFSHTKNALESLQINFRHVNGGS